MADIATQLESVLNAGANQKEGRDSPLNVEERLILQNFFDTDIGRRKQFLKELGFEMNPKDENEYRPLGSDQPYAEIDPGISKYFEKGGLQEVVKDLGDISFDVAVAGPATAAGATAGGTAGGTVGSVGGPAGTAILGTAGAILGGAAGNEAAEALKEVAGDLALSKDIPPDRKTQAIQSLIVGAMGPLAKGVGRGKDALKALALKSRKEAIINAAKSSGNNLTEGILQRAAKEPDLFSEEAVKGANKRLKKTYDDIFGTESFEARTPKDIKGGVFRTRLDELSKQQKAELEKLSSDPRASFGVEEINKPIDTLIADISFNKFPTEEEKKALQYLKGIKEEVQKVSGDNNRLDFKTTRQLVDKIQSDAFDREIPGSNVLKRLSGGDPEGLKAVVDQRATQSGSNLVDINSNIKETLDTYNQARINLTPSNIQTAFLDKNDTLKKEAVRETALKMDSVLGTKFADDIETGSFQRVVEELYRNPKAFGSGLIGAEMVRGAVQGGAKGGVAGVGIGIATGVGTAPGAATLGTIGAVRGAKQAADLASPGRALQILRETSGQEEQLTKKLAQPLGEAIQDTKALEGIGAVLAGQQAAQLVEHEQTQSTQKTLDQELEELLRQSEGN